MILLPIFLIPLAITIYKDRKDYFEIQKKYEIK